MNVTKVWTYKNDDSILGLEVGDANNNGQLEIIAFTKKGKLLILNSAGELLFEDQITEDSSIWCVKLFESAINDDNLLVIGGLDGLLRVFTCKSSYELEANWAQQFGGSISGIIIDDVNNDKKEELIIYSLDKTMRVLNPYDGSYVWGQSFEQGIGDTIIWQHNSKPERKEIYACGNDGTIRAFNGQNGELLWFKRFSDKVRCVSFINSTKGVVIACGGDDQKIHFINQNSQEEVKTIDLSDFVWKIKSFPTQYFNQMVFSTYSFVYFDDSIPIDEIEFTSKLICISDDLNITWELPSINVETIELIQDENAVFVAIGTTSGKFIVLNSLDGKILFESKQNSCINGVRYHSKRSLTVSGNDDGEITAYSF